MNATNTKRPMALLLDDDPAILRTVGTALEARGWDVRAATDGAGGVAVLLDELLELDVVIADLELPGRDAWSLLHLVRRAGGERDLGVVVLGVVEPRVRGQLLALGADVVVDPAAGPSAVLDAVRAVAARRKRGAPAWLGAALPAIREALLVARDAAASRLEPVPA
jgi:DNA-binding response OmpR family regulator